MALNRADQPDASTRRLQVVAARCPARRGTRRIIGDVRDRDVTTFRQRPDRPSRKPTPPNVMPQRCSMFHEKERAYGPPNFESRSWRVGFVGLQGKRAVSRVPAPSGFGTFPCKSVLQRTLPRGRHVAEASLEIGVGPRCGLGRVGQTRSPRYLRGSSGEAWPWSRWPWVCVAALLKRTTVGWRQLAHDQVI
jgi:hypothetical protein